MKYLVLIISLCGLALGQQRVDPLVSTKIGLIRGLRDNHGHAKFLGVPYGKIDDNNVFGAALPHPAFEDIFEAYDDSTICVQASSDSVKGTAECLTMNIFVPDTANSKNRLPVMVWIHGGAFVRGSAIEEAVNPLSLLKHDVIVIAINYRLGVYGFMCLDIPEVPGNAGLKDQVLALKWINEHIGAFGGDANQITIFGQSAGAMSTNLHLFTSHEKLFQRAIIQSGPAFSYRMMVESDNTLPMRLATQLGFNTTDVYEALSFLSDVDAQQVVLAVSDLTIPDVGNHNQPLTKPCVEKIFEGVENFLTDHPMNMKSSKASTTQVMFGHNSKEFAMEYTTVSAEYFNTYDFSELFTLGFDMNSEVSEAMDDVKHFYFGDENFTENVRWKIVDFGSDFIFNHPTQRMTRKLLESGARTVYNYVFSYSGSSDIIMSTNKTWTGASHADELAYLFDMLDETAVTGEDQLIIDRLTELWTNFAKYGNPTPQISELLPVLWTPTTRDTLPYLEIDSVMSLISRPHHDRMAFWDLFYKQYAHLQKWYDNSSN